MLRAITDKTRVARLHAAYVTRMKHSLGQRSQLTIGFKGETRTMMASHNSEVWFTTQPSQNSNRYWDAYGLRPDSHRSNNIVVEINVPVIGINRTVSALYAEDPNSGEVFLLHRGKVGGGRPGIGKNAFTAWHSGAIASVDELDGRTSDAFLITSLRDPHMAQNVTDFVEAVSSFKSMVAAAPAKPTHERSADQAQDFHDEFSGTKTIPARASTTADCNHGRVVTALKNHLEVQYRRSNGSLINTKKIDLALVRNTQLLHVWEVKTDISLQSLYTGIGQLIVHTMGHRSCAKTFVLPDSPKLPDAFLTGLATLGISTVLYSMGPTIKFDSVD